MSPRVSVVMPAFQAEATIGGAVSSVLGQTYRDFELLVVDDASTDATTAIAEAHPGPVRIVRQEPNGGVAAARNRGIAESGGELITFCDADDYLFPEHLAALVATFDRSGKGLATANAYWLYPGGVDASRLRLGGHFPQPDEQRQAILEQNFVSTMSIFRRRLVDEIGPFDEQKRRAEDWEFWLRAIFSGCRVALQPRPLALYRWSSTSLSSDWPQMDAEVEAVLDGVPGRVELTEDERDYVRRRLAGPGPRRLARDGDQALREGRYGDAARLYGEAAALCRSEQPLLWKARLLRPAPGLVGPVIRSRQLRREERLGLDTGFVR
jgi:glycosyltransferase involved in cell wall biosynthesis